MFEEIGNTVRWYDNTGSEGPTSHQGTPPVKLSPIPFYFYFFLPLSSSLMPHFLDAAGSVGSCGGRAVVGSSVGAGSSELPAWASFAPVDGVFWYTKHVHYTLVWI
jgi:hypothetical protein